MFCDVVNYPWPVSNNPISSLPQTSFPHFIPMPGTSYASPHVQSKFFFSFSTVNYYLHIPFIYLLHCTVIISYFVALSHSVQSIQHKVCALLIIDL